MENDPLADKVKSAAEFYLDYFESQTTQLKKYPNLWRFEKNAWEANIIDMFAWSPALCQYLEINKEWYDEELLGLKQAGKPSDDKAMSNSPFESRAGAPAFSWRRPVGRPAMP